MTADREIARIALATPDDAQALAAMHVASWHETYSGLLPDKILAALSVQSRAAAWSKIMQEPATERSSVIHGIEGLDRDAGRRVGPASLIRRARRGQEPEQPGQTKKAVRFIYG